MIQSIIKIYNIKIKDVSLKQNLLIVMILGNNRCGQTDT